MVSVWTTPSISVPVIVKVSEALLFTLDIVINEFNKVLAFVDKAPEIVKLPALPIVWFSTKPSWSDNTASIPLKTRAVEAVPDWDEEMASMSRLEVPFNLALILLLSGPLTITSPLIISAV